MRRNGRLRYLRHNELERSDERDHDDDENTDHLGRLSDPEVLERVLELEREQGGARYATGTD